jgi:Protein tyrosine and serine/threonine kinase
MSSNRTSHQEQNLCYPALIRFSSGEKDFASATSTNPQIGNQPYNLITFLAIAQKLEIDFLPITWQPTLSEVGAGGTAKIRQSLIHLQMSFAFKTIKDAKWIDEIDETQRPREVKTRFQALISEISVLRHPSVREHPNIISLLGICWDILPSGCVWPVLVFEKTALRDLWSFAASEEGKNISIETRLKLCADIATAVRDLHQSSKKNPSLFAGHAKKDRYHSR